MDIIIDTDPGLDDALALMLAIKSQLFNIKAITTVAGNSTIENTTRNARFVLRLLQEPNIPIYSGSHKPINRALIKAIVHGRSGLEGITSLNTIRPSLTNNAVSKILSIIRNSDSKITLVALGPLTNIAKALLKDEETMNKLNKIVIMGGAIKVPGNKNRVAEFNMFVDPEAADIVFRSNIKKVLIPLDACNDIKMTLSDFRKISNVKLRKLIISMIKPYIRNILAEEGVNAALMYDPLTIYYLINPDSCKKASHHVLIEKKGEVTRGMTVAELRESKKSKSNVIVIEKVPVKKFKRDFIRLLSA